MAEKVRRILDGEKVAALVCRPEDIPEELLFLTPPDFPFQVGVHNAKKGGEVKPHRHKAFKELKDLACQEIFYVFKGAMTVDLFTSQNKKFQTVRLSAGDLVILNCGHGITYDQGCRFFEIKQGPYRGREGDKEYF